MRILKLLGFYKRDECEKSYKLGRQLGVGSFAQVRHGIRMRDNSAWAVKIIDRTKLHAGEEENLRSEVIILKTLRHPNAVQLEEVYDCKSKFYMVMELMEGGELFDRIIKKKIYTEKEAAELIKTLLECIKYCHDLGIVHRDLKPENILYKSDDEDAPVKLADFGLAKFLDSGEVMSTACGTPGYVAPEILCRKPYGKACDIWSMGVILYILLCGFPPFYDQNNAVLFATIKAGKYEYPSPYWDNISDEAIDLIDHMLVVDPNERYTAEDVLRHSWVAAPKSENLPLLSDTQSNLKMYNAKRRLKASGVAVMMINRMSVPKKEEDIIREASVEDDIAENGDNIIINSNCNNNNKNDQNKSQKKSESAAVTATEAVTSTATPADPNSSEVSTREEEGKPTEGSQSSSKQCKQVTDVDAGLTDSANAGASEAQSQPRESEKDVNDRETESAKAVETHTEEGKHTKTNEDNNSNNHNDNHTNNDNSNQSDGGTEEVQTTNSEDTQDHTGLKDTTETANGLSNVGISMGNGSIPSAELEEAKRATEQQEQEQEQEHQHQGQEQGHQEQERTTEEGILSETGEKLSDTPSKDPAEGEGVAAKVGSERQPDVVT